MDTAAKKKLINFAIKAISVLLTVVFVFSVLGAVAISGVRHFFQDGKFESIVNDIDLNEVKFTVGDSVYTASDYIYESLVDFLPAEVKDYSGLLSPLIGNMVSSTIKNVVSSDAVDKIAKETMIDCVDYYLNSDAKEAKERLKGDIVYDVANPYKNVKTPEEAIRIYVRSFIINAVENTSGISSDRIIVLLSKNMANILIAAAVISAILLILCNLGCIFDLLLHFGGASFAFGVVIKVLQGKFESSQADKTLIGYQMLKPLVDSFSPNAAAGIIFGILFIAAFSALFILYKSKDKAQENNT